MLNVQTLKDTFYAMLSGRIAAGNAARTIVVRGVIRPAVLVVENELPGAAVDGISPAETFCLRWTGLAIDSESAGPLVSLECEIRYASAGTTGAAAMDRGRGFAAMDAELVTALTATPMNTGAEVVAEIAGGGASTQTATGTNIFWGAPSFAGATMRGERMERVARVEVYGYGE